MKSHSEKGFALPLVVVSTLIVGIIAIAVLSYISYATRAAGHYIAASQCRLSAQTALEITKIDILDEFKRYNRSYPSSWSVLNWFDSYSSHSVGSGGYSCNLMQNQSINNCTASVIIADIDKSPSTDILQYVHLTLHSTATTTSSSGTTVTKTIEETVEYALRRSTVFDYAYFVNNYGWFMGSGVTANGDIRANGNMSLDTKSYINGFAFAAPNAEIGASGYINVSGGNNTRHMSQNSYWSYNETSARPTSPPSSSSTDPYTMGYEATSGLYSYQEKLEMPFLGDLDGYRQVANNLGGTIKQSGKILVDGCYDGPGPSGIENGEDKGCIVLDGTSKPIVIDGPVVVNGDVIIKGTVSGQGAIYAGRNIHIVGDINYKNAPSWPKPDNNAENTTKKNQSADMLGLIAKGNIVLGNSAQSSWLGSIRNYIRPPFVNGYECDATDASIGYPEYFDGNYTAKDGGKKVEYVWDYKTKEYVPSSLSDRRYYESTAGSKIINDLSQSSYISNVDAVLYNNHAIMGKIDKCKFNGALVCRDEGCWYSSWVRMNWDIRLGSRSPDGMDFFIYLPMSVADPRVIGWREVI